ncbi:MAG: LamG-like jellyroll fold domain-containing protein [Opitutaceae bacterium]|jgi:hypothetical protein
MNASPQILRIALLASALFVTSLPAATLVDWTFDSYTAGQTITSVTSNTITLNANATTGGNATVTANTPNSGTAVSASFSGNNYLSSAAVVPELNFGTSQAFTIEGWFNLNSITNAQTIISNRTTTNVTTSGWFAVETAAAGAGLTFSINPEGGTSTFSVTASQTLSTGTWYYFAASRNTSDQLTVSLYSTDALLATGFASNARSGALTSTSATFLGARASDLSTRLSNGSLINEIRISDAYLTGNQLLWTSAIPEPSSAAVLAGVGALLCASVVRRRRQN